MTTVAKTNSLSAGIPISSSLVLRPSRDMVWAVGALVLWVTLALLYATGPVASDDLVYMEIARHPVPPPDLSEVQYGYARFGFWVPLRLADAIFGHDSAAFMAVPLVSALVALILTGLLARRWMGPAAARWAVLVLGLPALFVTFATIALPDTMGAMIMALGLWLLAPPLLDRRTNGAVARCLIGGFILALGFSAKESVVLLCPALALFVLARRTKDGWAWGRLALMAAGAAGGFGIDLLALWAFVGDPLFHLQKLAIDCRQYGSPLADHHWTTVAAYLTEYVRTMTDPRGTLGGWGPLYLAGIVYALFASADWTRLLLCCVLVIGGYLSCGTVDVFNYFPIYHQDRYLIPLLPVGALLAAHLVGDLLHRGRWVHRCTVAVLGVLIVTSLWAPNQSAGRAYHAPTYRAGQLLFGNELPSHLAYNPLIGSPEAVHRLDALAQQLLDRPIEVIHEPFPRTRIEWQHRYPGAYVLVTPRERRGDSRAPTGKLMSPESLAALSGFPKVASAAPPANRLNEVFSHLGLTTPAFNHRARIDVFRVTPYPNEGTTSDETQGPPRGPLF